MIYAVCVVIVGISAVITQSTNGSAHNDSDIQPSVIETGALRVVTATSIEEESDIPAKLSKAALEGTQVFENEDVTELGWKIANQSQVHGVYYMEAEAPEVPHREILKKMDIYSAVIVLTGYYVEEGGGIPIDRWEMYAWVYPNFYYDGNGDISYAVEEAFYVDLGSENYEQALDWMYSEYGDMRIVELTIPEE